MEFCDLECKLVFLDSEVSAKKTYMKLSAALLAVILLGSGCTALNYSYADGVEPINWRDYNDC